jgi:Xaa-Pro aminopeptidase
MNYVVRRRRLAAELKSRDLDAFIVSKPINVTYLTGFTGDSSYLIVDRKSALLVSDGRFTEQLEGECPGLATHIRPPTTTTPPVVAEVVAKRGHRKVGIEASHVTVAIFTLWKEKTPAIDWAPTTRIVEAQRAIKDDEEIREIRDAIGVAERAFAMLRAMLHASATEQELCAALEQYVRTGGGKGTSFGSIVAVGPRSALAHAPPTDAQIESADFALIDWGARGPLYCSDLTRMLVTRRSWFRRAAGSKTRTRPDDAKFAKVYRAVLTAQERAIAAIRPGVKAREVDAAARSSLASAGFGDAFSHGLGHGLGLEVHESPDLRASSEDVLQPGMVVTVEPGAYFPGWGGVRIEDDMLVTEDGCERLSTLPRDLESAQV